MKRTPLVLGAILLPLAGEGADRRMRVDQNAIFILIQFMINLFQDQRNVPQNFIIPKANNFKPIQSQMLCSSFVIFVANISMLSAINFNDNFLF
jgi:hypothetical protein